MIETTLVRVLALLSISGDWQTCDAIRWLDSRHIIADAAAPSPPKEGRQRRAHGEPAINVVGYRVRRRIWYVPSEGIHRTVAARETGRRIKARITGYYRIDPTKFMLTQDVLWRIDAADEWRGVDCVTDEESALLRRLGIQMGP